MLAHRRLAGFLLSTMLLAFVQAGSARAQCDSSYVDLGAGRLFTGTAAAHEQVYADSMHRVYGPDSSYAWDGSGYVRVALASRHFEAASHSEQPFYFGGSARDEYRLVGAPPGTEVTFGVRLVGVIEFVFYEYCGASGCNPVAGITIDGAPSEHLEMIAIGSYVNLVRPFDRSTTLTRVADVPFTLKYFLQAGTSHSPAYASITATVEFEGLPPGMRVVSCVEELAPTNSHPGTWGSLKVRYR
jgi:hypothetical protein